MRQTGMQIARRFFEAEGFPMLKERFSGYQDFMVCGLVGDGSECLGFDDELSEDHDFGADFCIWLPEPVFARIGSALQQAYLSLPAAGFARRNTSQHGDGRVGVHSAERFYTTYIGRYQPFSQPIEWLSVPDSSFATVTNGELFFAGSAAKDGCFLKMREYLLRFYPEDIRLKKLAAKAAKTAQAGQYNYMRSAKRGDEGAMYLSLSLFAESAMQMLFLLNRRYAPYYKWLYRAAMALPILGETLRSPFGVVFSPADPRAKEQAIEDICAQIIAELRRQSLTDATSDFLLDHCPSLMAHIADPQIRSLYFAAE